MATDSNPSANRGRQGMLPHSSHWGAFTARNEPEGLVVHPHPNDPDPSPLLGNFSNSLDHMCRVRRPAVRRKWLDGTSLNEGRRGGDDDFVEISWPEAMQLVADELLRVKSESGPEAIFGGSYGWSSAGRFHHAQSQIHRFLNVTMGGYVRSVNSYSAGASAVILPHVLGSMENVARRNVTWEQVAEHSEIVLAFGGMALKNSQVASGGVSRHIERQCMLKAAQRGCRFVLLSPLASDLPEESKAEWLPVRPGTDTALMMAMVHVLVENNLQDEDFLARYCTGWEKFKSYILGAEDGLAKTPLWAASITGIEACQIVALARSLVGKRVLVVISHSLQRSEFGEQPVWMGAVLAAVLGQLGLPGGGYNYALGTLGHYGRRDVAASISAFPQGRNGVDSFIPVARVADMLLNPGTPFDYNGKRYRYPDIKLAYWAGGNPFHHHQDLGRLEHAVAKLRTFIVHESHWTATAKRADIVLPATTTLERNDIGATPADSLMVAMHQIALPVDLARDDFEIFAGIADLLGKRNEFTDGRNSDEWLRHLYAATQASFEKLGLPALSFEGFWEKGEVTLPLKEDDGGMLRAFRSDPEKAPLPTPSKKLEIYSETIASFAYADCPGHPAWLAPEDAPSSHYPLWLVSNQPSTRLHSQLDFGAYSQAEKISGREICTMNPIDAARRGIKDGDVIDIYNGRGSCLAVAEVSETVTPGVVRLPTGAWYDPAVDSRGLPRCNHGNPNVLTRDYGTSSLSQGCTGQLTSVEITKLRGTPPPVRAHLPPQFVSNLE